MPFLLFVIYPLAEIAIFILVGEAIGVFATLALIVISSALGLVMLRDAGIVTALKLSRQTANPATILAEGGSRIMAGLLLLLPGFLSDLAALAILFPPVRAFLLGRMIKGAKAGMIVRGNVVSGAHGPATPKPTAIEGDFRRIDR
jgi:UPF0716 protein FxsA